MPFVLSLLSKESCFVLYIRMRAKRGHCNFEGNDSLCFFQALRHITNSFIYNIQHGSVSPSLLVVDEAVFVNVRLRRLNREVNILEWQIQKKGFGGVMLFDNFLCLLYIKRNKQLDFYTIISLRVGREDGIGARAKPGAFPSLPRFPRFARGPDSPIPSTFRLTCRLEGYTQRSCITRIILCLWPKLHLSVILNWNKRYPDQSCLDGNPRAIK